ncbi:kinase-like domain-containing protein [Xylogone sp. PMI_703]|nr:kinase-like domain-containing protein [Xylogone sp. PMI_703]
MATIYEPVTEWNAGEQEMQRRLRVPAMENPTPPMLTPQAAYMVMRSPLVAIGTVDEEGHPWTSLWGGEAGFARPVAQSVIGLRTVVDRSHDPVAKILLGGYADGEIVKLDSEIKLVSALAIDLQTRSRMKLYGKMAAGTMSATEEGIADVQLVVKIDGSLGNCPKYLNKKEIIPHIPQPKLLSQDLPLPQTALDLLAKADLFFISSTSNYTDMDTNHRGGPPGFVRVLSNDKDDVVLVYPEYSGNRFYSTLGNLLTTPQAGLMVPDFDTGDALYITGTTEVLTGNEAKTLISHSNLAVKIRVTAARYVTNGLSFRGKEGERSPYNPPVRFLNTEGPKSVANTETQQHAILVDKTTITPTIARFRFKMNGSGAKSSGGWKPGQYVALSFQQDLDMGYSHMNDEDPKSLNDDFLRTFTVSNRQSDSDEFEITIRKVGVCTQHLFRQNPRANPELPLLGFGGEFFVQQSEGENISFIAGGVGITPLLAQAEDLDLKRLHLYWTVRAEDLNLVLDTFERIPGLASSTTAFVTGKIQDTMILRPRYEFRDDFKEAEGASSMEVLRTSDNFVFLTSDFSTICETLPNKNTVQLAGAILPSISQSLSQILNHPNIISLVDIVHNTLEEPFTENAGPLKDYMVWEDMNAGSLAHILPPTDKFPGPDDRAGWINLAKANNHQSSLPESLCWHVLRSIAKALLWLHHGSKEGDECFKDSEVVERLNTNWQTILIRDVSPSQIWFQHPVSDETYGFCKLGGFSLAKVVNFVDGTEPAALRPEDVEWEKKLFWAPPNLTNSKTVRLPYWTPTAEIWSLGASVYMMMTGIPPPRYCNHELQISLIDPRKFSSSLREIVESMLDPDPKKRPNGFDLIERIDHAWIEWRRNTGEGREFVDIADYLELHNRRRRKLSRN